MLTTGAFRVSWIVFVTLVGLTCSVHAQESPFARELDLQWQQMQIISAGPVIRGQGALFGQESEFGAFDDSFSFLDVLEEQATYEIAASIGSEDFISGAQTQFAAAPSVAEQIDKSPAAIGTAFQRRSPISMDPYIRGYKASQIYTQADGQYWLPVRMDLDTVIGKLDPALIKEIRIINGPYDPRLGPGFGFIDINTYDSPRYDGYSSYSRTGFSVRTNGGQMFGRETLYGGAEDWGFVFSYGNRNAGDYRPGNASFLNRVPSSYKNQNFLAQVGKDFSNGGKIEFRYNRLDQSDTEYAAQLFDVDFLVTDAFSVKYEHTDDCECRTFTFDTWYNDTRFGGSTDPATDFPNYPVIERVNLAIDRNLGNNPTSSDQIVSELHGNARGTLGNGGVRAMVDYGNDPCWLQCTMGTDFRYVEQHLFEDYTTNPIFASPSPLQRFVTNMPRSQLKDLGTFAELSIPWQPYFRSVVGGRMDWIQTEAETGFLPHGLRADTNLTGAPESLPQSEQLRAFFIRNELEVDCHWTYNFNVGYAERAPSLFERYADGVFVGILQSGFSRVIGDPTLHKEQLWQFDVAVQGEFERARGSVTMFASWINEYVNYEMLRVIDPTGARLLRSINTDLAFLIGFEMKGEWDITDRLSLIGTGSYLNGRDLQIHRNLPTIRPFEARTALRLRDGVDGNTWGVEVGNRMIVGQDRPGYLRFPNGEPVQVEFATPGFTVWYMRGYYNLTDSIHLVGGIDNLLDRNFREHLDLQLAADPGGVFALPTPVQSPGFTPYVGVEATF